MNRKGLAELALKERRAGRDPGRVLAAAASQEALTPGDYGKGDEESYWRGYKGYYDTRPGIKVPLMEDWRLPKDLVIQYYNRLEQLLERWRLWNEKNNYPPIPDLRSGDVVAWIEEAAVAGAKVEVSTGDPDLGWLEATYSLTHDSEHNYGW